MHWKIHPPRPSRFPSGEDFAPLQYIPPLGSVRIQSTNSTTVLHPSKLAFFATIVTLTIKDFSRLLIQCKGPSPPHQLLLPLNPPGAATSLKGGISRKVPSNNPLTSGPSPTPLAWPSTTVVSMDLPSGDQLHARLHLPPHLLEDDGRRAAAPLLLHFPPSIGQQV